MTAPFLFPPKQLEDLERRIGALEMKERVREMELASQQAERLHLEIERGGRRRDQDDLEPRLAALEVGLRGLAEGLDGRPFQLELLHDLRHRVEALELQAREQASLHGHELEQLRRRVEAVEAHDRSREQDAERRHMDAVAQDLEQRTQALERREAAHAAKSRELQAERRELEQLLEHVHADLLKRRTPGGDALTDLTSEGMP